MNRKNESKTGNTGIVMKKITKNKIENKNIPNKNIVMKKMAGKAAVSAWVFLCASLLFGENGEAYIDPSVMTYVIQAVAGVVIATGAGIGFYWRRAKKKINNKLGIDENRNKEVESDEV